MFKQVNLTFNQIFSFNTLRQMDGFPLVFCAIHPQYGDVFYVVGTPDNSRIQVDYYVPSISKHYTFVSQAMQSPTVAPYWVQASTLYGNKRFFQGENGPSFFVDPFAVFNDGIGVYPSFSNPIVCGVACNQLLSCDGQTAILYAAISDSQTDGKVYAAHVKMLNGQVINSGFIGRYSNSVLPFNTGEISATSNYPLFVLQYSNGMYRSFNYNNGYFVNKLQVLNFSFGASCVSNSNYYNPNWGYSSSGASVPAGVYGGISDSNIDISIPLFAFLGGSNNCYISDNTLQNGIYFYASPNQRNAGNLAIGQNYVAALGGVNGGDFYLANYSAQGLPQINKSIFKLQNFARPVSVLGKYKT